MKNRRHHNTRINPHLRARMSAVYVAILFTLILCACTTREHSQFKTLPSDGWLYGDTLEFLPCDSDSLDASPVDMAIAVRHSNGYRYANIWMQMKWYSEDSVLHVDTVDMRLADHYGNWRGSGMGISYQLIDTVYRKQTINTNLPIKLTHIMRTDTLYGIEQIGIIIRQHP